MIKIKKIQEPVVPLYGPSGLVGYISSNLEYCNVRLQIKKKKLKGYYVIFNNKKIEIDKDGYPSDWPKGLYDVIDDILMALVGF